ncbi:MAG: glycosyltransferase 87 family protein, partial [Thermoanaerobaculia bacterium]
QAAGSEFSPLEGVALLALLWSGEGVRVCLGNGQHSIVVFFSVALMTWAMQSRRDAIAGGALALSLHKFSWTPFMAIVPFAKGRQRVLVFAFLTACMELAIFVARIGVGTARQALASYRKEILWWTSHTQKAEFDRFGFSQLSAVWFDVLPREAATIVHWTIVAVGVVTAILVLHRRQGMSLVAVSLVCLLCLVSVYHGIYDSICLYFPIVATFVVVRKTRERTPTLFFGLLSLVWLIDPSKLSSLLGGRLLPLLARCLDDGLRIFLLVVMLGFMHSIWRSTAFADDPV